MNPRRLQFLPVAVVACVALSTGAFALPFGTPSSARAADDAASVIAKYQEQIPELMAEQNIPGLAVALVDGDQVLWTQGFGHVDGDGSAPVTTDTIFSVQSMSKLFTATAVMRAVQAGRLDLDVPITTYLPDFTVHSAFEEHPEWKITVRMLLSHTAGFTHEAPIGNNDELDPGDFDAHVASISDTWLRFPVGTGYAYSNLGIDLAGYILEKTYGEPFATVMRDQLLAPLGMTDSTFNRAEIRARTNRALGHSGALPVIPVDVPMTAAGGLYTSATDLARFLRFQLNGGSIDGQTILSPAMIDEQRTVPAPNAGARAGYALGVSRSTWYKGDNADIFDHGGGGFGFLSDLWWAPQLQIGIAVLTNSADHHLQGDLALSILSDLVHEPGSVYQARLNALPSLAPVADPNGQYVAPDDLTHRIAGLAMKPSRDESTRWAGYSAEYTIRAWGVITPVGTPDRFFVESGVPYFQANESGTVYRYRLTEIEPGLFLAWNGETLDLRGPQPTWRNFELIRLTGGPAPWQWALLAAAALVALWWLGAAMVSTIRRRRRRTEVAEGQAPAHPGWRLLTGVAATLTAVLALGTIALLVLIPRLVDSGFLGWLELPLAERLILHLPLALAVASGCLVLLTASGWVRAWRKPAVRFRYAALVVLSVALTAQLAMWHLIGWGLT
ncbi:MAG: serine hydrolase domain-containing protein [Candidatus Limnocylindrales bacterium]|jgi:CubicO group peptidase (beta-lactamase class C family)